MVYGISFCPISKNSDLKELGVDDSKVLTEEKREELFGKLEKNSDYIGWAITVLSPRYISTSMFKRSKYNLNTMSHDTAIDLVKLAIEKGKNISIIGLQLPKNSASIKHNLGHIFLQRLLVHS